MATLNIGTRPGTLPIDEALRQYQQGDTLIFDEGVYELGGRSLNNLTLIGNGHPRNIVVHAAIFPKTALSINNLTIDAIHYNNGLNCKDENSTVTINNCIIRGERSGRYPALWVEKCNVTITDSIIEHSGQEEEISITHIGKDSTVSIVNSRCDWLKCVGSQVTLTNCFVKQISTDSSARLTSQGTLHILPNGLNQRPLVFRNETVASFNHIDASNLVTEQQIFTNNSALDIASFDCAYPFHNRIFISNKSQIAIGSGKFRYIDYSEEKSIPRNAVSFHIRSDEDLKLAFESRYYIDTLIFDEGIYTIENPLATSGSVIGTGDPNKTIINGRICINDNTEPVPSPVAIKNVTVLYDQSEVNGIYLDTRQPVSIDNVIVERSQSTGYPVIYAQNTPFSLKDCTTKTPTPCESYALYIDQNSVGTIESSNLGYIKGVSQSQITVKNSTCTGIELWNSQAVLSDSCAIRQSEDASLDAFYCTDNSSLRASSTMISCPSNQACIENSTLDFPNLLLTSGEQLTVYTYGTNVIESIDPKIKLYDGALHDAESQENLPDLDDLYGLTSVKKKIRSFLDSAERNQKLIEMGKNPLKMTLHSMFLGNPGTGKTTVARIMARELCRARVIPTFNFVEVSREDLVGEHIGETAQKTLDVLNNARGGILFIDEAYSLAEGSSNDFGREAVNTILKFMEDNRDEIVIIFAGYSDKMQEFLQLNDGLKSRIPHTFYFEDYTPDEIAHIGLEQLTKDGYHVEETYYCETVKTAYRSTNDHSNGRWIRNYNEKIIATALDRVTASGEDELTITKDDVDAVTAGDRAAKEEKLKELLEQLHSLTGLASVKTYVEELVNEVQADQMLAEAGLFQTMPTLHMVFTGNPGTGKTTVARILGQIFYNLGILQTPTVKEVGRSDLVGAYVGHTEMQTERILQEAMGGVLFVDEAYQLTNAGSENDFGKEAVEKMLTALENHRTEFIAIFAGYTKEMEDFLATNPGLMSRIPHIIEFDDYSPEEVAEIACNILIGQQWTFDHEALRALVARKYAEEPADQRANARWARNFTDKVNKAHKQWLTKHMDVVRQDRSRLTTIDPSVFESLE